MFLVCGEALFDVFAESGKVAADASSLGMEAVAGGSPFNVAIGLARLECESALLTGLADDLLGQRLRAILAREQVETGFLATIEEAATTLAMVGLDERGSPHYVFYNAQGADRQLTARHLPTLDERIHGIHVGSYSLVVSPTAETLETLVARESSRRLITLDPNVRLKIEPDLSRWRERLGVMAQHAHVIKVSEEDLVSLYEASPESVIRGWLDGPNCSLVVLTRGEQGVCAFTRGGDVIELPARRVEVVDTVGAGDTFQAALICWLEEHDCATPTGVASLGRESLETLLGFASRASALTCTRRGPDLPRRAELQGSEFGEEI
ncbi:carbohydrate kinase family protein [Kushneria phosphatilytica]|uniref:Carbohydrate kinase n=1 Tax=Kushneria phosphatilytica TaxID=657387 RepID=A0A1S1NRA5_9GAMM|nr:carbohydrate kinase [Kushneria phosphatilytica]OHV07119.1 carbohydrate kinase [Kushneria phosphatilytica]QEL10329.1 carbohydrate kinase [Kushneria phosphatilytica]